ncbi:MAG TPA: HupE/UreJ family protein [Thermoanaerobaculia bacterium]
MRKLALLCFALFALRASAHEIGTTQVRAELRNDQTYRIDVHTAPRALLEKLEARAKQPRTKSFDYVVVHNALTRFAPMLQQAADIRFGEQSSIPRVEVLPIDSRAEPVLVTIRYTGTVPKNAGAFTWSWDLVYATYPLQINGQEQWIEPPDRSKPFVAPTRFGVLRQYLILGFTHIVPLGLDHILFVIGMFLLTPRIKPVLMQVTAFTIAHTITLALTMYGLIAISPRIVEPLIALSIAYVAIENLTTTKLHPWRVAIVFAFGLLHGMGFAGVLQELGLPRSQAAYALVAFNVGVELGQLTVIAAMYALLVSWTQHRPWYRPRLVIPASLAIAAMGVFWMVQRVVG